MSAMGLREQLADLARIGPAATPVVSVYLDTRWTDEHQRDRVRIFLKNELAAARHAPRGAADAADLGWVEARAEALLSQALMPEARGAALFACAARGLREVITSRVPFENGFTVAAAPVLRPLAEVCEAAPATLVVFVDAQMARLATIGPTGAGEELTLETGSRGGPGRERWAQQAHSRYHHALLERRARHFEAVAGSVAALTAAGDIQRIVLAGDARNVAAFRKELPGPIAGHVVGAVAGSRHETMALIVARAAEHVAHAEGQRGAAGVDAALAAAAERGRAAAGVDATVEAVNRGAVRRLYLLKGWSGPGRACDECGGLSTHFTWTCPTCAGEAATVELGEAMARRVVAAGGTVETVEVHPPLAAAGGVAAELRYPA